jgi:hypothetical protein
MNNESRLMNKESVTQGHKEIWLSTSPMTRSTHWRQTVLYLHDELCMLKNEVFLLKKNLVFFCEKPSPPLALASDCSSDWFVPP